MLLYLLFIPIFFLVMLLYFKVAVRYNIVDKPNERSSHTEATIRGGGIIFVIAALFALFLYPQFWMPFTGLFIIGIISFIDDRITLSSKIRVVFHLLAVTFLLAYLNVFQEYNSWIICMLYIMVIGFINAYNFMDGINGITGTYTLVVLLGLQYVNCFVKEFIPPDLIFLPVIATLVFLFFNFRKKAKCFAGDVGSTSAAFWIAFLITKLIIATGQYSYILFLSVYGVDAVLTILHRLKLKQNIFKPHRLHLYQILANEMGYSHRIVSSAYALIQLGIIVAVIFSPFDFIYMFLIVILPLVSAYLLFKSKMTLKKA